MTFVFHMQPTSPAEEIMASRQTVGYSHLVKYVLIKQGQYNGD